MYMIYNFFKLNTLYMNTSGDISSVHRLSEWNIIFSPK